MLITFVSPAGRGCVVGSYIFKMQLFDPDKLKFHDLKKEDFEPDDIKILNYDASDKDDVSIEMTMAYKNDNLYILECKHE